MTQIVVATQIASATGRPISVTASTQPRQFHRNDHQNVPISHVRCDAVHVPCALLRVMYATMTAMTPMIVSSGAPASYLEVGNREEADTAHYPDDDIQYSDSGDAYQHKDGRPY